MVLVEKGDVVEMVCESCIIVAMMMKKEKNSEERRIITILFIK